jgi:hypothetical protein
MHINRRSPLAGRRKSSGGRKRLGTRTQPACLTQSQWARDRCCSMTYVSGMSRVLTCVRYVQQRRLRSNLTTQMRQLRR